MFLSRSVSLVAVLGLLFGLTVAAFAQPVTPNPFICMYGHYDGPGVTAQSQAKFFLKKA